MQDVVASGPLYFGRIDREHGGPLSIGRHAVADERNALLAINWRAPAAEPFYAATPAAPRGLVRRRRLDVARTSVEGYVDERLAGGDGELHLTEAIVEDITRRRVGEMRQIISTITPEQYDLIARRDGGALVVQGGPGTGKTAVGLHRAAWLLYADPALARAGVLVVGPSRTFIAYIAQVLPSLGEQSVEQRPIDALVSARPRRAMERARGHALASPAEVASAARATREFQRLVTRCWPRQTPEALVASAFKNRRRLAAAAGGLLAPADVERLLALGPPGPPATMSPSVFALLDEARWLIDPELRTYGHVVIDEAQNLTAMELRMIVRRAREQSVTVLGDIAQRTAEAGAERWEPVMEDAGIERFALAELLVSYRVPGDFLRLAAAVAPGAAGAVPHGVRVAPWPAVAVRADADELGEFDAAIVVEPAAILAERPDGGAGGLYTALTRSTRALAVVHTRELPPALAAAPGLRHVPAAGAPEAWSAGRGPDG